MPVENRHKRFRIDLLDEDAIYFESLAKVYGVKPNTLLKLVLSDAAKNKVTIRSEK
jgi:hypothetical protein